MRLKDGVTGFNKRCRYDLLYHCVMVKLIKMKAHIESLIGYVQYLKELGYDGFPLSGSPHPQDVPIRQDINGNKNLVLKNTALAIDGCAKCGLSRMRAHSVPGEGNCNAALMFIGEAPGYDEDRQGRPFVGRAGALLTDIITAMGLKREDVFIANVIKCRPPDNREPMNNEIESCFPYLKTQIDIINPKIIVTLGRYSTSAILGTAEAIRISELRGKFFNYNGIKVMPTFHPAYLLRNGKDKKLVWDDMKAVLKELDMHIPIYKKGQ